MGDFFLDIVYKNKTVRFKVVNPEAPLSTLMTNLTHAIGEDGKLIFDFPSIDETVSSGVKTPRCMRYVSCARE